MISLASFCAGKLSFVVRVGTAWSRCGGSTDWRGKTHQKSAEFLVAEFFPWTGIHAIGCHNSDVARQVQDLVNTQAHRPAVTVEPAWYY